MNAQTWWYLARATGYVAWALVTISVISGLLLSTRLTNGRPTPAWILDLHRFLAGAAVAFTGLHIVGLVADNYVHFGAADILVPFASSWRTGAVALGVIAMYLLAAVEISSLLMRRLPRRLWRGIHLSSYVAFWAATFHPPKPFDQVGPSGPRLADERDVTDWLKRQVLEPAKPAEGHFDDLHDPPVGVQLLSVAPTASRSGGPGDECLAHAVEGTQTVSVDHSDSCCAPSGNCAGSERSTDVNA